MEDSESPGSQDGKSTPSACNKTQYDYNYTSDVDMNISKRCNINKTRIDRIEAAMADVCNVMEKYGNASLPSLDPDSIKRNGWKIDEDSPWYDVPKAIGEIVSAKGCMKQALEGDVKIETNESDKNQEWWTPYLSKGADNAAIKHISAANNQENSLSPEEQKQFEQAHMEWATNAFAEELEALRNGQLEEQFGRKRKRASALKLDPNEHSFVVSNDKSSTGNRNSMSEDVDVQVLADMLRSGGTVFSDVEKKMLVRARAHGGMHSHDLEEEESLTLHELRRRELGYM